MSLFTWSRHRGSFHKQASVPRPWWWWWWPWWIGDDDDDRITWSRHRGSFHKRASAPRPDHPALPSPSQSLCKIVIGIINAIIINIIVIIVIIVIIFIFVIIVIIRNTSRWQSHQASEEAPWWEESFEVPASKPPQDHPASKRKALTKRKTKFDHFPAFHL